MKVGKVNVFPLPLPSHKNLYLLNYHQCFYTFSSMLAQLVMTKIACPLSWKLLLSCYSNIHIPNVY